MSVVNVTIPRTLTLDEALKVVTGVVAATGHPTCFSSRDIRFTSEVQDYRVDAKTLEVHKAKT
jgi:hypothetical protein